MFRFFNTLIKKVYELFQFPIFFSPEIVLREEESSLYDSDKDNYYAHLFVKK